MPLALHGHCMASINTQEVILAGGFSPDTNDFIDTTYIYNMQTKEWKTRPWMKLKHGPRMDAGCAAINWGSDIRVAMVGGWNNSGMASTEMFDRPSEKWEVIETNITNNDYDPPLDHKLRSAFVTELDKKPLAIGGVKCTG